VELHNLAGREDLKAIEEELKEALQRKMIVDFDYLPLPIPNGPKRAAAASEEGGDTGTAKAGGKQSRDKLFDKLDTNHDGKLSFEEFSGNRKPEDARAWFKARDTDGDGFLSREEFVRGSVPNAPKK